MNKKTRSLVVLFALAAGSLVTLATSPANPVKAAGSESSALYKITAVESEAPPLGCVSGCPTVKSNTPTFAVQNTIGTTVASASKIDTFSTSAWDQASNAQKTFEGGCAIVSSGLKCWGDNSRGQLGDETSTSSLTTPVTATENGVAISGVTDLSTNGLTTCIVVAGALKCVGAGNWEGNYSKRYNLWEATATVAYPTGTESNRVQVNSNLLNVYNSAGTVVYTKTDTNWIPDTLVSKNWSTFASLGSNVAKVQVGSANNGSSTPTICVLLTTGLAKCAVVTAGTATSLSDANNAEVREADCDGLTTTGPPAVKYEVTGDWCTNVQIGIRTSFERHQKGGSGTLTNSATWTWADAGVTGAVDIAMPSDSWGASSICFAGATTVCRTFSAGEFGATSDPIEGGENSQAVYMTSGWGPPGLCLYSNNTISCGAGTSGPTGTKMATKVTAVAVMSKPLNIFFGSNQTMQKLYFLLPTGLLAADAWILTCSNCQSSSGSVVAPVTAFTASTATSYTYATKVNGSTDNADYIPLTIASGTRKMRSSVGLTVQTSAGEVLKGVSVRWTAPDAPGTLSSSSSSTLATDDTGFARSTVSSGPVTFTLSVPTVTVCPPTCTNGQQPTATTTTVAGGTTTPAAIPGSLASGATLQAASITAIVGDTGDVTITVPNAPAIVQRKITVTMPDSTVVPNATVQLKNNYLTYAYQNSGTSTSTWSSRPKDTKGYLGQMNCAYCFVAPPKYATGADGSVTFPSFNPASSSSAYDADVVYDDGDLSQTVKKSFAAVTDTVQMPFMASIKIALPAGSTDANNVKPDANGAVTLTSTLKDGDGNPINKLTESVEEVKTGTSCDTGGLVASTAKVTDICANGGVTASSVDLVSKASIVRAMSVRANAGCSAIMTTTSASNGQATLVLCPSASTKYRVRGTGAVGSQTICVQVNNLPCTVSATSVNTNTPTNTPTYNNTNTYTPTVVSKVAVMKKGKVTSFTTINKTAKVSIPKGAKVVLVVAVTTKKYCSVSGTSVKALLPGSCTISVKVTPTATAKVKKPKTTTTKIKITVSK